MTIKVAVFGARGRMGATVCEAVEADDELELVASADVGDDPDAVGRSGAEVVVDFTVVAAARENLRRVAAWGMHAVVGTTGLGADDVESLRAAFTTSNCVIAPNFAI